MPSQTVRMASEKDLPAILELTTGNRALLARLEPRFWNPSAKADELHAMFIQFLLTKPDVSKRVLEKDGRVIGFAVAGRQPDGWIIDDVCLAEDADWETDGVVLLKAIEERPAAMSAPHGDTARVRAAADAGLELMSTYRVIELEPYRGRPGEAKTSRSPEKVIDPPFHTWGPLMPSESVVFIVDDEGGYAVASAPIPAPPIYDPGGTSVIIDRVVGEDREALLAKALSFAADRGDVQAILVVGADDKDLTNIADRLGARHPVDVFRWPSD